MAPTANLKPTTRTRTLRLILTTGGALIGVTNVDDAIIRELCPPRPGDPVDASGPSASRSNLETLITRAAVAKIRIDLRTDLPPELRA